MQHDVMGAWSIDPRVTFLNHGSFGACPLPVLEAQSELRARIERQPVQFLARDLEGMLDRARAELATLLHADADDVAFVTNATTGVNTVLRALRFQAGDELVTTDHEYNASRNALDYVAERAGARVVTARVPFPIDDAEQVVTAIERCIGPRTKLLLVDHVTSPTGLVLPIQRIVQRLAARGIDTLVDGAHAPGMVDLDLEAIGAAYYTGNCHKWLCAPKGAAFLHVRRDRQSLIRPLNISHGANSPRTDRSRFRLEFDWYGTMDPTPFLCVPHAIAFLGSLLPGGIGALHTRNRELCLRARSTLCKALGIAEPSPASMIGSLASLPIPPAPPGTPHPGLAVDPLQTALRERAGIEVPVFSWPSPPQRLLRVSAQAYNDASHYERLAAALRAELEPQEQREELRT